MSSFVFDASGRPWAHVEDAGDTSGALSSPLPLVRRATDEEGSLAPAPAHAHEPHRHGAGADVRGGD